MFKVASPACAPCCLGTGIKGEIKNICPGTVIPPETNKLEIMDLTQLTHQKPTLMFTVVRDPFDKIVSAYAEIDARLANRLIK